MWLTFGDNNIRVFSIQYVCSKAHKAQKSSQATHGHKTIEIWGHALTGYSVRLSLK